MHKMTKKTTAPRTIASVASGNVKRLTAAKTAQKTAHPIRKP